MVNYCSVYKCTNNSDKNPKLGFFLVPGDPSRQMIWLPKMGRQEWLNKTSEVLHKKRICSEHFSREMISGTRLKKDAWPNVFKEGVGEKGVNEGASTSASTPRDIDNVEESINSKICTTPERRQEGTQTSSSLSSNTPRKRKLRSVVKNLRKKLSVTSERQSAVMGDKEFVQFCRRNFNVKMADFIISQLERQRRKPKGYRTES